MYKYFLNRSKTSFAYALLLFIVSLLVFKNALSTFFAQDDFILISEFSQNDLLTDIKNVFGPPKVTHWRPLHNLYFLIAGNIFGKNYVGYHLITFFIHIFAGFLIYKIITKIANSHLLGIFSSLIYVVHPAHFVTLYWISGAATTIGFFFLLLSFYFYLQKKNGLSLLAFLLSLLASEAMIVGISLFVCYRLLFKDKRLINSFSTKLLIISGFFVLIRFLFLTPRSTYDVYQIKIWPQIITNTKYYLLRTVGFAETSGDLVPSIILSILLIFVGFAIFKRLKNEKKYQIFVFGSLTILLGLFPFFLISNISPHYMNISIFGFAILLSFIVSKLKPLKILAFLAIFLIISFLNINKTYENNWVIKRANLAQKYIREIENANLPAKSTIIFNNNYLSTSDEAYISLGTGRVIDFWFKDKNYQYCFTAFENCYKR